MKTNLSKAYIGIGANLGEPVHNVLWAAKEIAKIDGVIFSKLSSLYRTSPISSIPQPDYINAICAVSVSLPPGQLFLELQKIEKKIGKIPKTKEDPRMIDLDLIAYDSIEVTLGQLVIPHPMWKDRLFVLKPLSDLISVLKVGDRLYCIQDLIKQFSNQKQLILETIEPKETYDYAYN